MNDKELIRRALLGDQEAQKECTEKEIVLPCPHCGSEWTQVRYIGWEDTPQAFQAGYRGECTTCNAVTGAYKTERGALAAWNTRPAPPIGRCGECKIKEKATVNDNGFLICPVSGMEITDNDFCSYFEPREE